METWSVPWVTAVLIFVGRLVLRRSASSAGLVFVAVFRV